MCIVLGHKKMRLSVCVIYKQEHEVLVLLTKSKVKAMSQKLHLTSAWVDDLSLVNYI